MPLLDFVLGRPLASSEERAEQIGPAKGIPIFGLDALGSAAYGPEAALTLLIPLGLAGLNYIVPLSASIIVLLVIVYLSYRQTIAAYPTGGGSYIVAHQNLGTFFGLLAASALLIDYALDAAVGISAGIGGADLRGSFAAPAYAATLPFCARPFNDRESARRQRSGCRVPAPHLLVSRLHGRRYRGLVWERP